MAAEGSEDGAKQTRATMTRVSPIVAYGLLLLAFLALNQAACGEEELRA